MPFSASSLRIASARAKLRCFLARVRSATRASTSASVIDCAAEQLGRDISRAALGFGPFEGAAGGLGVVVFDYVEDGVEVAEDGEDPVAVANEELALINGRVGGADEVEDGRAGLGGVQIVGQGFAVFGLRFLRGSLKCRI